MKLGRVGVRAGFSITACRKNIDWRNKSLAPASQRKTGIYNTSDGQGQTRKDLVTHVFPESGRESIFQRCGRRGRANLQEFPKLA